jgi:uncharacterized protein involved in type VI secretion and phage assembly
MCCGKCSRPAFSPTSAACCWTSKRRTQCASTACSTTRRTLAFVSRLMEEEGIAYFFDQTDDAETLVLVDHPSKYRTVATLHERPLDASPVRNVVDGHEVIVALHLGASLAPTALTLRHYDWDAPSGRAGVHQGSLAPHRRGACGRRPRRSGARGVSARPRPADALGVRRRARVRRGGRHAAGPDPSRARRAARDDLSRGVDRDGHDSGRHLRGAGPPDARARWRVRGGHRRAHHRAGRGATVLMVSTATS